MPFEKGHPHYGGAGRKGRNGRKKALTTLINEAMEQNDQRLPELLDKLFELAKSGDREAIIYIINLRLGKPKEKFDVKGGEELGKSTVIALIKTMAEEISRLIQN